MNYRHAFHAGNFADVFKHVLLSRLLVYLTRKVAPFRYIDTHAGLGWYDLGCAEAERTGEWRTGIGQLLQAPKSAAFSELLGPYLDTVGPGDDQGKPSAYPGSPGLAQQLLRADDRMILCERHPDDVVALRQAMGRDKRVKVLAMDGYQALKANVPPPERRGLVLVDPPFEDRDEFAAIVESIGLAHRKWATGTYAIWYPIKELEAVAAFSRHLRGLPFQETCQVEMMRDATAGSPALRGSGLFVVNPPYVFAEEAARILPLLCAVLTGDAAASPFRARIAGRDGLFRTI